MKFSSSTSIKFFLLFDFLFSFHSYSQNPRHLDSLNKRLQDYEAQKIKSGITGYLLADSEKVKIYLGIAQEYYENDQLKTKTFADSMMLISTRIGYKKGIANACNSLAVYYMISGLEDSALLYYKKALQLRTELKDKKGVAAVYNNIGALYDKKGDYPQALKYYLESLKLKENLDDKVGTANTATNVGNIYTTQHNFDDALIMYKKAFALYTELKDTNGLAVVYQGTGLCYYYQFKDSMALVNFTAALALDEKIFDLNNAAVVETNLGDLYKNEKNYEESLRHFNKSLELYQQSEDREGVGIAHNDLGAVYETLGDLPKALEHMQKGLDIALEMKSKTGIRDAYQILSVIYQKMNNYKEAYHYAVLYKAMYDTIYNQNNVRDMTKMQMQYDFDKKEATAKAEMEKQQIELHARQNQLILASTSFGIIVLLGGTLFYLNRKRKATQYKQNLAESEMKALRAQMNPHFMFNSLNAIQQMVLNNENENAFQYLDTYSKLTRKILENSEKKWIPLRDEIKFLELYLQIESLRFQHAFTYEIKTGENVSVHDDQVPAMIIQPLVENAIKHGLLRSEGEKRLFISFLKPDNNGKLEVIVEDNGVGRDLAREIKPQTDHQSMSLAITENRLRLLDEEGGSKIIVEDLKDHSGKAAGTRVRVVLTQPD